MNKVLANSNSEVMIEAEGGVDYDVQNNITTAQKKVKLVDGNLLIEAEKLVYYGESGLVEASGGVKITQDNVNYQTEAITYNLKEEVGKAGIFTGVLHEEPRDFNVSGESIVLKNGTTEIGQAKITRCPRENPDYYFSAKSISIIENRVHLKRVVLRVKGIPLFYFPSLSFSMNQAMPETQIGYSEDDGFKFKYHYLSKLTNYTDLEFLGDLSIHGDSEVGIGLKTGTDNQQNHFNVIYNFDDYWKIKDQLLLSSNLFELNLDGVKEFSDQDQTEIGFKLTRKYWDTATGRWQVGILARQITAKNDSDIEYGGLYSGLRLDYNPNPYATVSYLYIKSHTDKEFGDLMEDFGIGDNLLYEFNVPLSKGFSIGLVGVYNEDDSWIKQSYTVARDSCCFKTSLTWERIENTWDFNWRIKF